MKRFTLMMIALLTVLVVNAAAPVKKVDLKGMKPIAQQNLKPVAMGKVEQAPASLIAKRAAKAKASRKKVIAAANDLIGSYQWDYATANDRDADPTAVESTAGSSYVTIEAGTEENTLTISGMFPKTVTATVDLENQQIVIEKGQDAGTSSYGSYSINGIFYNDEDEKWYFCDLIGYVQEDGSVAFPDDIWIARQLTTGEYAGYMLTPYWLPSSTLTPVEPLTPVAVPDGVEKVEYNMSFYDYDSELSYKSVLVAVDGDDVYFGGLSDYIPEAWIKGTKEENTITFPADQYLGEYGSNGSSFMPYSNDAVFTYNPVDESYSLEGTFFGVLADSYYDGYFTNPVLTKVVEKAAVPAQPTISGIEETSYGDVIRFTVPAVDEDGENLSTSKLYYQFFYKEGDVEAPVVFTTKDFPKISEDMTVIPFGFTDNWDFYANTIYLNMDHSTWSFIGIQSIYLGAGEEHKSEIYWYDMRTNALFDFNNMEVPTSNSSNEGDITEPFEIQVDGISLTISASTTATPNRFWSTALGNQLRIYGGTLTFKGINRTITNISFEAGKWDAGNSANVGELDGQEWTGSANEVVITIAKNTQINNITVYYAEDELEKISVPDELETTSFLFSAMAKEASEDDSKDFESYEAQLTIGIDGTDVYIKGFAQDIPEAWLKGTLDPVTQTVTIPANQYMGSISVFGQIYNYFVTGMKVQQFGERVDTLLTDIVMNLDPISQTISTDQTIALNEGPVSLDYYMLFNNVVISPIAEVAAVPVTPTVAGFKAESFPYVDFVIFATGTNDETLLQENLSYQIWIEKAGVASPLTLTADLYKNLTEDMTTIPYTFDDNWDIYASGARVYLNQDINEMVTWTKIGAKSIYTAAGVTNESEIGWYDLTEYWASTGVKGITTDAATTSVAYYDLQGRRVDSNAKGMILMQIRKADGTVKTVKVVR